jgi:hypothetical protein
MDCTVNKKIIVWQNGHNVISLAYNICLNPFKLCWDREDNAYARVRFQAIPSTLIFEHIFDPLDQQCMAWQGKTRHKMKPTFQKYINMKYLFNYSFYIPMVIQVDH